MENFVSVIVPVLNASKWIDEFMKAILNQSWKEGEIEILVIDNGSTDETIQKLKKYPIKLLKEEREKGPYSARNLGLKSASGNIFALTDVNKIPDKDWIKNGIQELVDSEADLIGGNITFDVNSNSTASQIYDSLTFNNNQNLVLEEGAAATGNLFFTREVLNKMGYFPENIRSGMDVWWTKQAAKRGFKLVYSDEAKVVCKPRNFNEVLKKSYRVGKSHPHNLKEDGKSTFYILAIIIRTFAPPKIKPLKNSIRDKQFSSLLPAIWMIAWFSKIAMAFGRFNGLINLNRIRQNTQ